MSDSRYVWQAGPFGVLWDSRSFFCTRDGVTCATVLCSFPETKEGLAMAMVYADARHRRSEGRIITDRHEHKNNVQTITEEAHRIFAMGPRKAHAEWLDS